MIMNTMAMITTMIMSTTAMITAMITTMITTTMAMNMVATITWLRSRVQSGSIPGRRAPRCRA